MGKEGPTFDLRGTRGTRWKHAGEHTRARGSVLMSMERPEALMLLSRLTMAGSSTLRGTLVVAMLLTAAAASLSPRRARATVSEQAELVAAQSAYEHADFAEATRLFERVLRHEGVSHSDLARAHAYLLTLAFASGDTSRATAHSEAALALDLSASPPASASPDTLALFERVRGARGGRLARLGLRIVLPPASDRLHVVVEAVDTPDSLTGETVVSCRSQGVEIMVVHRPTTPALELVLPRIAAGAAVECDASATTLEGTRFEQASAHVAAAAFATDAAPKPRGATGPNRLPLYLGIGAGATVLAVIAIVAIAVANNPDDASFGPPRFAR